MALISCPECGKQISDKASSCPSCGYPLRQMNVSTTTGAVRAKSANLKWIISGIALIVAVCIIWAVSDNRSSRRRAAYTSYSPSYSSSYSSSIPKTGNEKALDQARSYLNSSAFSYEGLVDQLEFHGFSATEARYGADHCGADWEEQAVKKAKSYINSSAFSYTGLIDQLEFSKFTSDEAKYGADHCGADWNEQAAKKARSYLNSFPDWTKSKLKSQLEFSGFTSSQAQYGVDHCGKW